MQQDYYNFAQGMNPMNAAVSMGNHNPYMAAAVAAAYGGQYAQQAYSVPTTAPGAYPTMGYPMVGQTLPTQQRFIDSNSSKVRNQMFYQIDGSRRFEDLSNSTDESIHLVRSRKHGESAPVRYETEESKRRTQSGASVLKDSESDDRSVSPRSVSRNQSCMEPASDLNTNFETSSTKTKSKKKKDKKAASSSSSAKVNKMYNYVDSVEHVYLQNGMQYPLTMQQGFTAAPQAYGGLQACFPGFEQQQQQQQQQQQPQQGYYAQFDPQQQFYGGYVQQYDAPGAPLPQCEQQQQQQQQPQQQVQCPPGCVPAAQPPQPVVQCPPGCVPAATPQLGQYYEQAFSLPEQQIQSCPYTQQTEITTAIYPGASLPAPANFQYFEQTLSQQQQQPCLPPGAKIVAEYFLGYLDDPQCQQQQQQAANETQQCAQSSAVQNCQQYTSYAQSSSDSSKEDVDIEVWEKSKSNRDKSCSYSTYGDNKDGRDRSRSCSRGYRRSSCADPERSRCPDYRQSGGSRSRSYDPRDDELRKLKDDIIRTIQNELGNLKLNNDCNNGDNNLESGNGSNRSRASGNAVQPIFLMPKGASSEQPKPIYIPRNVYVPVIRPVFVPRERIIVRPQIIHVARPVLVDRPVPVQQRPIVIERDRPVPVRVETIEKTETPLSHHHESENGQCTEVTKNIENAQEVTYHEFTQVYPPVSGEYFANEQDILQNLQSKSNEDLYQKYERDSKLESVLGAASQGYTLEVLDQRISDKFEKTDTDTIKARYGVEAFQYLPPDLQSQSQQQVAQAAVAASSSLSSSKKSAAEFYSSSSYKNLGASESATGSNKSSSNIYTQ